MGSDTETISAVPQVNRRKNYIDRLDDMWSGMGWLLLLFAIVVWCSTAADWFKDKIGLSREE